MEKRDDVMFTFLDALISGDSSGAIERSEKRGQSELCKESMLPVLSFDTDELRALYKEKGIAFVHYPNGDSNISEVVARENEINEEFTKERYKKLGFENLQKVDDLFYKAKAPNGWRIEPTEHSMWNHLFDEDERMVARIFYKAAFYDRSARIAWEDKQ